MTDKGEDSDDFGTDIHDLTADVVVVNKGNFMEMEEAFDLMLDRLHDQDYLKDCLEDLQERFQLIWKGNSLLKSIEVHEKDESSSSSASESDGD